MKLRVGRHSGLQKKKTTKSIRRCRLGCEGGIKGKRKHGSFD